jgi:peroxiredoxin
MIKVGDRLPEGSFRVKNDDGTVKQVSSGELFAGKKVVFVGVPGAFTSTCHNAHIPTFVDQAAAIKAKGVDRIAVMAVNDHHVMKAWKAAQGAGPEIDFLADGAAVYTRAMDLVNDATASGLGIRCKRFAMIVEDGVVKWMNLEPEGGGGKIVATGASSVLEHL